MKILKDLKVEDLAIFDIETVRLEKELSLDSPYFTAWAYKKKKEGITDNDKLLETYYKESGLYPEFSKIVCISVGRIVGDELITKSYSSHNEKELLESFNHDIGLVVGHNRNTKLVGFFSSGFDTPFVQKRMIINGIEPHDIFDTFDDKPWLINSNIDISILWKGGSYSRASLLAIATAFGLPSPKDELSGDMVGEVYWNDSDNGLERITKYCESDILTLANIFRKIRFEPLLTLGEAPIQQEEEVPEFLVSIYNGGVFGEQQKIELKKKLDILTKEERNNAILILEAMSSKKRPRITKAYLKELKKNYE